MAGLVFQVASIPNKSYLKTIRPSSRAPAVQQAT